MKKFAPPPPPRDNLMRLYLGETDLHLQLEGVEVENGVFVFQFQILWHSHLAKNSERLKKKMKKHFYEEKSNPDFGVQLYLCIYN